MTEHRTVPQEVLDVAVGVASEVARRTPYVTHADLMSEAAVWALSNRVRVTAYLALDERERDSVIAKSLRHRMRRVAQKARADAHGYRYQDLAWYSVGDIAAMLPCVYDRDAWSSPPSPDSNAGRGSSLPSERGGWIASLADVADAIRKLPARDRVILQMRFLDDLPQREIAETMAVSEATVSETVSRAPGKIQRLLGGERPAYERDEVGHRRVISNTHAQAITGQGYEG